MFFNINIITPHILDRASPTKLTLKYILLFHFLPKLELYYFKRRKRKKEGKGGEVRRRKKRKERERGERR